VLTVVHSADSAFIVDEDRNRWRVVGKVTVWSAK